MKVYSSDICIDCRNLKYIEELRGLHFEHVDIIENTTNMKEFFKYRDTLDICEEVRETHGVGIPLFVLDDKFTLDIDEAFSWINQPPVRDEEIREHRQ